MTQAMASKISTDLSQTDWLSELDLLAYAYGKPQVSGLVKQQPAHFIVTEIMDVEPSGEGEHYWLDITKTRLNTDAVAKTLARFSGVANRDVGYSGMKDFHAITRQWFSVWKPKGDELDWSNYRIDGVDVNRVVKHSRKIKRGTHRANRFQIRIVGLSAQESIEDQLNSKLECIQTKGVPNYFGAQRFGRGANNLPKALDMFSGKRRIKDRILRGILLSSARSWLFNSVISARINAGTWLSLYSGEPANLNGSNSVFSVVDLNVENQRLENLDIHPTAPLWGERNRGERNGAERNVNHDDNHSIAPELEELEQMAMSAYAPLKKGLEDARIEYQRRALRIAPNKLEWQFDGDDLCLSFELQRGQFATSVLRELVSEA